MDLTKRYWVFVIYYYYPSGGFHDIELTTDDEGEATKFATDKYSKYTDVEVFDRKKLKIIFEKKND